MLSRRNRLYLAIVLAFLLGVALLMWRLLLCRLLYLDNGLNRSDFNRLMMRLLLLLNLQ